MSTYLLKKQTLFPHKMADGKYKWQYANDNTHVMFQYTRLTELMISSDNLVLAAEFGHCTLTDGQCQQDV